MNKILLPLLALILVACASPQVAVTSKVTVTSPPPTAAIIPTPTLHPQFVELQSQIAAAGERFSLKTDGTVEDKTASGVTSVPGLFVDKNGAIILQGQSSQVTISPEDVSFDDKKGVNVAGYTLDEATGLWGVAQEIITTPRGIGFQIGAPVAGQEGVFAIDKIIPPVDTKSKDIQIFEDKFDDTTLGFKAEDNQWVYIPTPDGKYRIVLQNMADPSIEVAEMGNSLVTWDYSKMKKENGESILLDVGKLVPMGPGFSIQSPTITSALNRLAASVVGDVYKATGGLGKFVIRRVISQDRSQGVLIQFSIYKNSEGSYTENETSGVVCFKDNQNQNRFFYAVNFDEGQ